MDTALDHIGKIVVGLAGIVSAAMITFFGAFWLARRFKIELDDTTGCIVYGVALLVIVPLIFRGELWALWLLFGWPDYSRH